jgi:hypothetical protein
MITFFEHPNDQSAAQWREWIGHCGEALPPASKGLLKSDRMNSFEQTSKIEVQAITTNGAADAVAAINKSNGHTRAD